MSESLLKAILRLFAVVAREDDVTGHERDQIKSFLEDHLNGRAVETYLRSFDDIIKTLPSKAHEWSDEVKQIDALCSEISPNLTQKQKAVILLELISIIQADGEISDKEDRLVNAIGK